MASLVLVDLTTPILDHAGTLQPSERDKGHEGVLMARCVFGSWKLKRGFDE